MLITTAVSLRSADDLPEHAVARLGTARMRYNRPSWAADKKVRYACGGSQVWIVSGTELHLWNSSDCTLTGAHRISGNALRTLDVPGAGRTALIADAAGELYEWNLGEKKPRQLFNTGRTSLLAALRSPDGKRILTLDHDTSTLEEWSISGGTPLAALTSSQFYNAVYGPVGQTVFLLRRPALNVFHYDLKAKKIRKTFLNDFYCRTAAVSPDKSHVLIGSRHMATEWQINGYKKTATYKGHHGHEVCSVAYTPDGTRLLTGARDGSIRVWNRQKRTLIRRFAPNLRHVLSMQVSPDGARVLSWGGDGLLTESVLATGKPYVDLKRHMGPVTAIARVPGRSTILTGSTDGFLRAWDAEKGGQLKKLSVARQLHAIAVLPDGKRVIAGAVDGCIYEYSLPDYKRLSKRRAHRGYVRALSVQPDAAVFLTAGDDGCVKVWPLDSSAKKPLRQMKGHLGGILCTALTADGSRAAGGDRDGTIRVWDVASGRQIHSFYAHAGWVQSLAFNTGGTRLLSGGADGDAVEWSLENKCSPERILSYGGAVRAVAYAGNGKYICAGGDLGVISVWPGDQKAERILLKGHDKAVLSLTPLSGLRIASGSSDTTAVIWKLPEIIKKQ